MSIFLNGILNDIKDIIMNRKGPKGLKRFLYLVEPKWYDS